ncbi:hypothetical protein BCV52_26600 [Priestia aryabhattai]|nr:hypothetical protein BCV52_26600 [Priestia aryabhattai]
MHNIYLLNYWTLYKEFINIFKELKFKQIPLALISNFYNYIDQNLKKKWKMKTLKIILPTPL